MICIDDVFEKWLIDVRRQFHQYPEIMFQEVKTTREIKRRLTDIGVEHYGYEDMTGVVAIIRGGKPGKTIALRADIDALPIEEQTKVPFKSRNRGMMHACGHDAHTTIMLGVAKYIVESGLSRQLQGNVKFIFQPAEEGDGASDLMINRGVLEDPFVDRILAGHLLPSLPVETAGVYHSQSHASTDPFHLVITGKGGHAGRPNEAIDPIVAGSYFVSTLQTIVARNIDPLETAVAHVGKFISGDAGNVIPGQAELAGGVRALNPSVRNILINRLQEIVKGLEISFNVKCKLTFKKGYPPCINDPDVCRFIHDIGVQVLGPENVKYLKPSTGAEDFAFFAMARPSTMIMLGCRNEEKGIIHPLHSERFDLDERVLGIGVRVFSQAVCDYLS